MRVAGGFPCPNPAKAAIKLVRSPSSAQADEQDQASIADLRARGIL